MEYSQGIPDDSPENSVRFIKEILQEEAEKLGCFFFSDEGLCNDANYIKLNVSNETSGMWFDLSLTYFDSARTSWKSAQGRGRIAWGDTITQGTYGLQFLLNDSHTRHQSPPFIWALYSTIEDCHKTPPPAPIGHLDGVLLRKLLHESLGFSEPNA